MESLLYSLISSGENSKFEHFAAAIANHYSLTFSFHQVPITAGWTETDDMRCLPDTSTHGGQCDSSIGHPSKYKLDSALLNFTDLTRTGYHSAMCYHILLDTNTTGQIMVSLDGCLMGCSSGGFKVIFNRMYNGMSNKMINGMGSFTASSTESFKRPLTWFNWNFDMKFKRDIWWEV